MKLLKFSSLPLSLGAASFILFSASAAFANTQTHTVQVVDYSGKPPFKRTMVELDVHDVAKLETVNTPVEYVEVRTVDMSGKPPFKRSIKRVPVYDVAQLEVTLEQEKPALIGRPPFKRH
ncbi:hypothetical protein [Alteromonas sp. C1M14]|uniref:hypothetical protein n=1 Tax=Alteromonas sp. C1M14 TaxID=2841567 RepID=UPI001C087C47|nr:hypothetical protein [Alteromonas sp. C1M14]MBU2978081.1 hypothetical protein [Alteromonas sp. C1M14]